MKPSRLLSLFAFLVLTLVMTLLCGATSFGCGGDDVSLRTGFTVDAAAPSVDSGPASDTGDSRAPFNVVSAASTGNTLMTVTFDAAPNPTQATTLSNYAVPGLTLSGTPTVAGNIVTLRTSSQSATPYTVTVSPGVTRGSDGKPLSNGTATFGGRTAFNLTSAVSPNSITVTLTFDAPPNEAQAADVANYSVVGLALGGTPTVSGNTVTLTTAAQTAKGYTITVSNVTRASDGEPLTIASANFTGTITFNVASAAATRNTVMTVTFDSAPNPIQASALANYSVPGLTLSGTPVLNANVVTINTSSQAGAQTYTVTVSGVNRASDGSPLVTKTATFQGRSTFNVQNGASLHASAVSVTFDAAPNAAQATNASNYSIPGLIVSAPQLAGNTVTLTTTLQSAQQYSVSVANVTRASDGEPLSVSVVLFAGRLPPTQITDLAAQSRTHTSIELTWTAPSQDASFGGSVVASYEVRYAKSPITTLAEFLVATPATPPAPVAPGQLQTLTVTNLETATTYYFAVRALDGAGNPALISNTAIAATKARAKLLITEVALANTSVEGFDFVEAVVTQGGWAEGLEIKQLTTKLYGLGPIDLVAGDRVVVHATGLPGPAGFDQEDISKSKTSSTVVTFAAPNAYDVYSTTAGLTGTDNLITANDGTVIIDAVAISNRDSDASGPTLNQWGNAQVVGAWTFGVVPADGVNDCASQRDAVNISQNTSDLACGGFATGFVKGKTINRVGTTDTNTKAEWYVEDQTPGEPNKAPPIPTVLNAIATSTTSVDLTFDHEIAPASVTTAAFTITGLGVTSATLSNVHVVTITTGAQAGGTYQVDIANSVTSSYGLSIAPPFALFCTFTALPALIALNEVSPNLANNGDLIELKVTRGGELNGYQVRANPSATSAGTILVTLPAICATANDLVVVHLAPAGTAGNGPSSETIAKDQHPWPTFSANYNGAWDVLGNASGIGFTSQVLAIRNAIGDYIEAAAFSDMSGTASTLTYLNALAFIQAQGLWLPVNCGGVACTDATTPTAKGVAASWVGVSSTIPSLPSVGRLDVGIQASSWVVGPSSFGL